MTTNVMPFLWTHLHANVLGQGVLVSSQLSLKDGVNDLSSTPATRSVISVTWWNATAMRGVFSSTYCGLIVDLQQIFPCSPIQFQVTETCGSHSPTSSLLGSLLLHLLPPHLLHPPSPQALD
jgi:hypothetical protein